MDNRRQFSKWVEKTSKRNRVSVGQGEQKDYESVSSDATQLHRNATITICLLRDLGATSLWFRRRIPQESEDHTVVFW